MSIYGLGNPGGDFASAFAQTTQVNNQRAMIAVQQQRANIESWSGLSNLAKMGPDVVTAIGPSYLKSAGIDPTSDEGKMIIKSIADPENEMGQQLSSLFGNMAGGSGAQLSPSVAFKMFQQNPDGFMQFAAKMQGSRNLGSAVDQLTGQGGGQPGQNQSSSQGVGNPPNVGAPMAPAPGGNGGTTPAMAAPGMGVPANGPMAPTASPGGLPAGIPNAPLATKGSPAEVAPMVSALRTQALKSSILYPDTAKMLNDQADRIEGNAIEQEKAVTESKSQLTRVFQAQTERINAQSSAARVPIEQQSANAATQQAQTSAQSQRFKQLEDTYGPPMSPSEVNAMGMPPGTIAFRSGTGKPLIASSVPDSTISDQYTKPAQTIIANGQMAKTALNQIDTLRQTINAPGTKPGAGTAVATRRSIGTLLTVLGMKDTGASVLGNTPLSELQESQVAGLVLSGLRENKGEGMGGAPTNQEELEKMYPNMFDTRPGQNLVLTALRAQYQHMSTAQDLVVNHLKNNGNVWTKDQDGNDALDKAYGELSKAQQIPPTLSSMIAKSSGGGVVQTANPPVKQATPSNAPNVLPPISQRTQGMTTPNFPGRHWDTQIGGFVKDGQ